MGSIMSLFGGTKTSIELGDIFEFKGGNSYIVDINGSLYQVFSAVQTVISIGSKVLIAKPQEGQRYVIGVMNLLGRETELKEINRDG